MQFPLLLESFLVWGFHHLFLDVSGDPSPRSLAVALLVITKEWKCLRWPSGQF